MGAQLCLSLLPKIGTEVQLFQKTHLRLLMVEIPPEALMVEIPPEAVDGGDLVVSNAISLCIRKAVPSKRTNPHPCCLLPPGG